ncbi:hypothetical protein RB195_011000 [Necator americanus]|uniref:Uncharacterized protein n=1 Tax=Necator americanus TaxID=51031 RepID=A0ABR1D190_NECAM
MGIRDPSVRMTSSLKIQLKTDASTCFGEFGRIRSAWLMLVLSYDVIASANGVAADHRSSLPCRPFQLSHCVLRVAVNILDCITLSTPSSRQ